MEKCDQILAKLDELDDKIDGVNDGVVRLEERTKRMDREGDLRFDSVHARIDEVRSDARRDGALTGAPAGGVLGLALAFLKDHFLPGS